VAVRIVGDRLYALSIRPQEWAAYGGRVAVDVRYAPMIDVGDPPTTEHWRVAVVDIQVRLPADGDQPERDLDLLKIGWEVALATDAAMPSSRVPVADGEIDRVVTAIGRTIADVAERAGVGVLWDDQLAAAVRNACVLAPPPAG
jgi:hypothetical protein